MPNEEIQKIPLEKVLVSEFNTRQPKPTDPAVIERAESIKERGQLTPGIARPHPKKKGCFELVAGAIRRTALALLKLPTMDIIVREMDDETFEENILIENLQRTDPDPREEAKLVKRLVDRGVNTPEKIAAHLGKPKTWAARRIKLLDVIPGVLAHWAVGHRLSHFDVEMMEFIGSLPASTQKLIADSPWDCSRAKDRKELEKNFKSELCDLSTAPFDLNDPRFFVKGCGPGCASDSSKQDLLFDLGDKKKDCGHCLNTGCYMSRLAKAREVEYKELSGGKKLPIYTEKAQSRIRIGDKNIEPVNYEHRSLQTKETEGATKVILVTENGGKMVVRWRPKEERYHGYGREKPVKTDKEKLAEKRSVLQGKRWLSIHPELREALAQAKLEDLTIPIDDLIAAFGLPYKVESSAYGPADIDGWKMLDARKDGYPTTTVTVSYFTKVDRDDKPSVSREQSMWPSVQCILLGLIPAPKKISDAVKFVPHYERIAALIKFPLAEKKREADLKILPPKSWGPTDPHTLESTVPTKPKLADRLKATVPVATVKAKPKKGESAWVDVGDGKKKPAPKARKPAAKMAANAKKPGK